MRQGVATAGVAFVLLAGFTPAHQAADLAGRWRGTSTCIKADWNAACNDERVVYFFERNGGSETSMTVHAYKYVGASLESMGDLKLDYEAPTKSWVAPFSNERVSIKWIFQTLPGGRLTGRLIDVRRGQLGRNVSARRDSIQTPPPPLFR